METIPKADALSIASVFSGPDDEPHAIEYLRAEAVLDDVNRGRSDEGRIPPDYRDLARLHAVVRQRKAFTILEFGIGYSTLVMADALAKNRDEWDALDKRPRIRNSTPFQLHAVDTSASWIESARALLPDRLRDVVATHHSGASAGTFRDRACHYYDRLPDIVPDLIYLDGPDPADVVGDVNGLSWQCSDRVVTAADILRMEPQLLPGTMVVVDGRTANVRFLEVHLYRTWSVADNSDGDVTVLELIEPPLGRINAEALAYRNCHMPALDD